MLSCRAGERLWLFRVTIRRSGPPCLVVVDCGIEIECDTLQPKERFRTS